MNALVFSTDSGLDELEPNVSAQGFWIQNHQAQAWRHTPQEQPRLSQDSFLSAWTDGQTATNLALYQGYEQGLLPHDHPLLGLLALNEQAARQLLHGENPLSIQ